MDRQYTGQNKRRLAHLNTIRYTNSNEPHINGISVIIASCCYDNNEGKGLTRQQDFYFFLYRNFLMTDMIRQETCK